MSRTAITSFVFVFFVLTPCFGQPRITPMGELPPDARLSPLKDLNGYFPMVPPKDEHEWAGAPSICKTENACGTGIVAASRKTPLNAVIHSRKEMDGYTIEKVYFETMPGYFLTGNLYRPLNLHALTGKNRCILCPHGHWRNGRF